jgi:hypothetical protein
LRRPLESAQYTSIAFGNRCKEAEVRPSTGSVGDACDNAMCESFFATLECELIDRRRFRSHSEARMAVFQFIEGFYNRPVAIRPWAIFRPSNTKETRSPKQARLSPNPSIKAGQLQTELPRASLASLTNSPSTPSKPVPSAFQTPSSKPGSAQSKRRPLSPDSAYKIGTQIETERCASLNLSATSYPNRLQSQVRV